LSQSRHRSSKTLLKFTFHVSPGIYTLSVNCAEILCGSSWLEWWLPVLQETSSVKAHNFAVFDLW